jgi:simple sugar transport system permease protein
LSEITKLKSKQHGTLLFFDLITNEKTSSASISIISILLSLIAASIFLLLMGSNPFEAFGALLKASGFIAKARYSLHQGVLTDFTGFLGILAPMMLAALGVIIAMRAGLFNIGISGQMIASAGIATVIIGYSGLDAVLAKPLVIVIGILVGGTLGGMVGFLKYRFNINEVVSTIMINYIVNYVAGFFINTYFVDISSRSSMVCSPASRLTIQGLTLFNQQITFPIGILLAFAGVFAMRFLLERTTLGFELKAVGLNPDCARYAGIHVGSRMMIAMFISGMFAGLAGVTYYVGHFNTIVPKDLPALGYDSIAVSLLGNLNPVGSIFASIIITIFQRGSVYMSSVTGVPKEIAAVVTGIILVFSACGGYMRYIAVRQRDRLIEKQSA